MRLEGPRKAPWLIGGFATLVALSALLLGANGPSLARPLPLHQFILAVTTSYGFLVVIPLIYVGSTALLWKSRWIGLVVLGELAMIVLLTIAYFMSSWDYGLEYQGALHTYAVAIENALAILITGVLAFRGVLRSSRVMQLSANLVLYVMLVWCAFPYLGELI